MTDFTGSVSDVLEQLGPGDVMSYGEIAEEAGYPGAARAVGNLLAITPGFPWWRVVTQSGRLAPGHERLQTELLRSEGVRVRRGRVIDRVER